MTTIVRKPEEWISIRSNELLGKSVGFVPTMGALHGGHQSLIEQSLHDNEITVVSIFVNPTQFNSPDDLRIYPRNDERDIEILSQLGVHYAFLPSYDDLYPDKFTYKITEHHITLQMEGVDRPGHFDGVLTVVMKLLNIIAPSRSYFGEKDYQQYKLISKLCEAFFVPVEVVMCPTIRDTDGLALSSRNALLSPEERKIAPQFPALLRSGATPATIQRDLQRAGFKVDYITDLEGRRFGAVWLGRVRLIDNVEIESKQKQL